MVTERSDIVGDGRRPPRRPGRSRRRGWLPAAVAGGVVAVVAATAAAVVPGLTSTSARAAAPTVGASGGPSGGPSVGRSARPSAGPSGGPSVGPSAGPSAGPSVGPSAQPSAGPSGTAGPASPAGHLLAWSDRDVKVLDPTTGVVTGTADLPGGVIAEAVSGTADPRVFLLLTNDSRSRSHLLRLTLDGAGRVAAVREVPAPQAVSEIGFVASPDGRRFGLADMVRTEAAPGVQVVDTARGTSTVYTLSSRGTPSVDVYGWDGTGRYLTYSIGGSSGGHDGVWRLDTRAAGHDLVGASRRLGPWTAAEDQLGTMALGPDGRFLYAGLTPAEDNGTELAVRVDIATGRVQTVFRRTVAAGSPATSQVALDPTGKQLLVLGGDNVADRIDLASGHATELAAPVDAAAALTW